MIRRSLLAISTLALFAGSMLSAQDKPNFSGTWKMDGAKSDFGPMPAPDKLVRTITHKDPDVEIKTTQSGQQGEVTSELKYKTDGTESVNKLRGQDVKSVVKWEGEKLVVKSKREVQGMEISITETWTMTEGKVLTITNAIETPQGSFEAKIVLDKQ
jgi:hypothetical protein